MIQTIIFTPIEAEVLKHRLIFLQDEGEDILEELFEGQDLDPAQGAEFIQRVLSAWDASDYSVILDVPEAGEILAECLEGSTFFGSIDLAIQHKEITRQKAASYRKAALSACGKIEEVIGRSVEVQLL